MNDVEDGKRKKVVYVDGSIRAKTVVVIDGETNQNLGTMPTFEAIRKASDRGLNLIQMSSSTNSPPTCKILDYGKYRYDESKRIKAQNKKQRESQVEEKELIFRPGTALNDLKIKAKKAVEFLDDGAKVKVTIKCLGRELAHPDVFKNTLNEFLALIPGAKASPITNENRWRHSYLIVRG